ncbi:MAG: formylglycine-generating enzyme family protein [Pseudomonadota bacterium]
MLLDPNPREFPSAWAHGFGEDPFGLWQGLELNGARQVMRWVPPGRFQMGSTELEPERFDGEAPHKVTLTKGYWLADTACTQAFWQAVMGNNPSHFKGDERPVDTVSWEDCQRFLERANAPVAGLTLRLPSEAEWEYAARAGTQTPFWWGNAITPAQANYDGNLAYRGGGKGEYREETVDALAFEANDFGLFQVHGNVWEWCGDWYGDYPTGEVIDPTGPQQGRKRVLRGGCWFNVPRYLRAAFRFAGDPAARDDDFGFRLAGGEDP